MMEQIAQLAVSIGGFSSIPLLLILWRLDRRIMRLETVMEMQLSQLGAKK